MYDFSRKTRNRPIYTNDHNAAQNIAKDKKICKTKHYIPYIPGKNRKERNLGTKSKKKNIPSLLKYPKSHRCLLNLLFINTLPRSRHPNSFYNQADRNTIPGCRSTLSFLCTPPNALGCFHTLAPSRLKYFPLAGRRNYEP